MVTPELVEYIKGQVQQGVGKEVIEANLIKQGWVPQDVADGYVQAVNQIPAKTPVEEVVVSKGGKRKGMLIGIVVLVLLGLGGVGAYMLFGGDGQMLAGIMGKDDEEVVEADLASAGETSDLTGESETQLATNEEMEKKEGVEEEDGRYVSDEGFAIKPPEGWAVDDSGKLGTLVIFINSEVEFQGEVPFAANINVTKEVVGEVNLEEYFAQAKVMVAQILTDYVVQAEEDVVIDGVPGKLLISTYKQGDYNLKNQQMMVIKEGVAFVVTATALESSWSKYEGLFRETTVSMELD